jgi:DNA-binding transcriptional ArsR family regulator
MKLLDLTGRDDTTEVTVESGLAYEFLVSLCAYGFSGQQETLESWPEWFEMVRTRASARLMTALQRIGMQAGKIWVNLLGLAVQPPRTRDVGELLGRIDALDPLELRMYLLGYHVPAYQLTVTRDVLRKAAQGEPEAKNRLLSDRAYFSGEADPFLRPLLSLDVDQTRSVALDVLIHWYEDVFRHAEAEARDILERDAEARRSLMGAIPNEQLIEVASGVQYIARPDIRQIYLIPQLAVRPWVLLCEHDDARLFCYPASEDVGATDRTKPPARLLGMHKALADEKRLRMLKTLAASSATLQELADRFGLPKSTAHHHLAILRAAGLVRMSSELDRRHSIRFEALPELCDLLNEYLEGSPQETGGRHRSR